jgi:hypothetical protein
VILQAGTLWWREIARFVRQRSRVTGAILQPLVFWALLGSGRDRAGAAVHRNLRDHFDRRGSP